MPERKRAAESDPEQPAMASAVESLRAALHILDQAGESRAAIAVSHALALIDGTDGKLPS